MAGDTKYLKQKRGRWIVQVSVPKDLRDHFGKTVLERYLGTADRREAQELRWPVVAELKAAIKRARQAEPMTVAEIAEVARLELRNSFVDYERQYRAGEWARNDVTPVSQLVDKVVDGEREDTIFMFGGTELEAEAKRIIADAGAMETPESVETLCRALFQARVDAEQLVTSHRELPPQPGRAPRRRRAESTAPRFSEAAARYIEERQRDPQAKLTEKTAQQLRGTFRLFAGYVDDGPLDGVRREDAAGFLDDLAKLHPRYGYSPGASKLSLVELLEKYPAGDGPGLSNKTLTRHQSALKTFYRWAIRRGIVSGANIFADLSRPQPRQSQTTWLPFEVEELNALFDGTKFEVRPARANFASSIPWLMAVALFSGLRQGEIAELSAEDIKRESGVDYFDVTEAKSEAGVRRVPVHSQLITLGWLDYVAAIGSGPLFPGLRPGGPDMKRSYPVAKKFTPYRRRRHVDRPRIAFHSFRKNFVRALELAKIDQNRAALVVGHERQFTYRVYSPEGVDMTALQEVVEAVSYTGFNMSSRLRQ